jgi:hypothetical protein
MTTGAAYGQGIYASSQFGTAGSYAMRYNGSGKSWLPSILKADFIIGVIEVIKKKEYDK